MTTREACNKDNKHRERWNITKVAYQVGSAFKGCHHCGEYELTDRGQKRYKTGFLVFRAHQPKDLGWHYWCFTCGSFDAEAWENFEAPTAELQGFSKEELVGLLGALRKRQEKKEPLRRWKKGNV